MFEAVGRATLKKLFSKRSLKKKKKKLWPPPTRLLKKTTIKTLKTFFLLSISNSRIRKVSLKLPFKTSMIFFALQSIECKFQNYN